MILSPVAIVEEITVSIVVFILAIFVVILLTLLAACSLAPEFSSAAVAICSIEDFNCSIAETLSCAFSKIVIDTPAMLSLICCCFAKVLCLLLESPPAEDTAGADELGFPFFINAITNSFLI